MGTKSKSFAVVLVALFLASLVSLEPVTAKAQSKTIVVPDDYPTIQMAIDSASSGDIVHVRSGIYTERIVVDKPLSLIGENRQTTTIDGGGTRTVVQITGNNVELANFTIRNAGTSQWYGHGFPDSCIDVEKSNNVNIRNNLIANATVALWSYSSTNVKAVKNFVSNATTMGIIGYTCTNSLIGDNFLQNCGIVGIHIDGNSVKCEIMNNTITNCEEGIEIEKSTENKLSENKLLDNNEGVIFSSSNENSVEYCWVENNSVGVDIYQSNKNTFSHNSFIDNGGQVVSDSSVNTWDNGDEGNYWSDYLTKYPNASEVSSTGIGNTQYFIDDNNADHFPLMKPITVPEFPSTIINIVLIMALTVTILFFTKNRRNN